jgi:hypothetical protein
MVLMIHQSHSKDDLILIANIFELKIDDIYNCSKIFLQKIIWAKINECKEILAENEYFEVENKKELLEFLEKPNPNKNLSVKEKSNVLNIARNILIYSRNGYYECRPNFIDFDHLVTSAKYISQFGDISTVRKAIIALNCDSRIKPKLEIKMSKKTEVILKNRKKQLKNYQIHPLIKTGKFVISFN